MTDQSPATPDVPEQVECPPTREPSVRQFIMAAILSGYGLYALWEIYSQQKYLPGDQGYTFTLICGWLLTPLGLIPLVNGIRLLLRKFHADQEGLGYKGQPKVPWKNVRRLVMRGKGRLDVHYDLDGEGVLKLDSWYLQNFYPLVELIEAKTPGVPTESATKSDEGKDKEEGKRKKE